MVVFIIVGLAVWTFQKDIFVTNSTLSESASLITEVRQTFKTMMVEIRSASISSTGAYPLAAATGTSFIFYSDIDDDGLKERIRYFVDGSTLKKGVIKPTGNPLSYNPSNEVITTAVNNLANGAQPVFEYYDENYDGDDPPLTSPVNLLAVRLVKVTIKVDKNPTRPPAAVTMVTQVSVRNLKDNF